MTEIQELQFLNTDTKIQNNVKYVSTSLFFCYAATEMKHGSGLGVGICQTSKSTV